MRIRRPSFFLAMSVLASTLPLAAHVLPPNDHPGMLHFHVRGIVRNGSPGNGPGVPGVTVGYYGGQVVAKGVFPNVKPSSVLHSGACSAQLPPVMTAGDGTFDFVVYFQDAACEVTIKNTIRNSWGADKQNWFFKPGPSW